MKLLTLLVLLLSATSPAADQLPASGFLSLCEASARSVARAVRNGRNAIRLKIGTSTRDLSKESFLIFEKVSSDPKYSPSKDEMNLLQREGVDKLFENYRQAHRGTQKLNDWIALLSRSKYKHPQSLPWKQIKETVAGIASIPHLIRRYRFADIFEKLVHDSDYKLSPIEKSRLKEAKLENEFEDFRLEMKASDSDPSLVEPGGLAKEWHDDLSSRVKNTGHLLTTVPFKLGRVVLPLPRFLTHYRARAIYDKVAKDPSYQPTPGEIKFLSWLSFFNEKKFLEKYNLVEDLERFRAEVKRHGEAFARISQLRRLGAKSKWLLALMALASASMGEQIICEEESFDESSPNGMSKYDEKVELIFLSPLPHASIRMGGIVYNYGQFMVQRLTLDQYQEAVGFGKAASGSHTRIELNLSPEEKYKLREALENDVAKLYPLVFPLNDCIAETNKAVNKAIRLDVPVVADRSQVGTIAYYKVLHNFGSDRVKKIYFAARECEKLKAKAKEVAMGGADAMFFLSHAPKMLLTTPLWDQFDDTMEIKE